MRHAEKIYYKTAFDHEVRGPGQRLVVFAQRREQGLTEVVTSVGGFREGDAYYVPIECYSEENLRTVVRFAVRPRQFEIGKVALQEKR